VRSPQVEVVGSSDTSVTFTAIVPDLPPIPKRWPNRLWIDSEANPYHFFSSGFVPIAAMRVQASGGGLNPPLDVVHPVGVTSVWSGRFMAAFTALFAFALLRFTAHVRGVPGGERPVLGIISTRDGYASLSQFQLIVWSFVVGLGAVYVLTLSGGLIDVPTQMLVLLGITGVTTLGARVPDGTTKSDAPKLAPPTTNDVGGVAVVAPGLPGGGTGAWSGEAAARRSPPRASRGGPT
jgi:hypothetical protein